MVYDFVAPPSPGWATFAKYGNDLDMAHINVEK